MGYTREQRAANAAKAAEAAAARTVETPAAASVEPDGLDPDESTVTRVQLKNDPRDRAMAELEERQQRTSGITEPEPDEPTTTQTETPTPAAEPATVDVVEATTAAVEPPKTVKQTVNGREHDVPLTDIEEAGGDRAWRIQRAAKDQLEEAKATHAKAERMHAEMQAMARAMIPPPAPRKSRDELIQAIRFGTAEEAEAAFSEMSGGGRPAIDQGQMVMQASAITNYNAAKARFTKEFQDVVTDQTLQMTVTALENRWVQGFAQNGSVNWSQLATIDFDDGFRRIGNQVRGAFRRPSQPQPAPAAAAGDTPAAATSSSPSSASDREERKSSIVNLPTAAARAVPAAEEKPESREEILNNLRKSRGIPIG